jgi:hypothetical protein
MVLVQVGSKEEKRKSRRKIGCYMGRDKGDTE